MKNYRPFLYLFAAVLAAGVVLLVERPESPRVHDASEDYFITIFDINKIANLEIEQLIDGVDLKRDGDNWLVALRMTEPGKAVEEKEGNPLPSEQVFEKADKSRVMSALHLFENLDEGVLVSDNPEKQSLYQVNAMGTHVKAIDNSGKPVFDIIIGKNGPDFASSYIRRADENKVYLVHRTLSGFFSPRLSDWLEKEDSKSETRNSKEIQKIKAQK